jgi:5-methylcytosine-specific restriction endonuclease McrA
MKSNSASHCELCERPVEKLTVHHLVPRSQGKKGQQLPTALLCPACHKQLHALYSNRQLARELRSVEQLKTEPSMQKFLDWVRKQDPNKHIRVRK